MDGNKNLDSKTSITDKDFQIDWNNGVNLELADTNTYFKNDIETIKLIRDKIYKFIAEYNANKNNYSLEERKIMELQKLAYTTLLDLLRYYYGISNSPTSDKKTEKSFIDHIKGEIEAEYKYLTDLHPDATIEVMGRKKSLFSFLKNAKSNSEIFIKRFLKKYKDEINNSSLDNIEDIFNKISHDMQEDKEYLYNEISDLFGLEYIIEPPSSVVFGLNSTSNEITTNGRQALSDYVHQVYSDYLDFHSQSNSHRYNFVLVNTKYHENRLEQIKTRPAKEGFVDPIVLSSIFIPDEAQYPEFMNDKIDGHTKSEYTRDYDYFPLIRGYQGIHSCAVPQFSKKDCRYIATHFFSKKTYKYQKIGFAAHVHYKTDDEKYNRYLIPTYYRMNKDGELEELNFSQNFKTFMGGVSFKDYFNISYKAFLELSDDIQDRILSLKTRVRSYSFDKTNNSLLDVEFEDFGLESITVLTEEDYNALFPKPSSDKPSDKPINITKARKKVLDYFKKFDYYYASGTTKNKFAQMDNNDDNNKKKKKNHKPNFLFLIKKAKPQATHENPLVFDPDTGYYRDPNTNTHYEQISEIEP